MDEKMHIEQADHARGQVEHWNEQIAREMRESEMRLQNLMTDMDKEREASALRLRGFESNLNAAMQRDKPDEVASWQSRIHAEQQQFEHNTQRIQSQIDFEKQESQKRIDEYKSEAERAEREMKQHLETAASMQQDREKRQKIRNTIDVVRSMYEQ